METILNWWLRNTVNSSVEVGRLSHYSQGFTLIMGFSNGQNATMLVVVYPPCKLTAGLPLKIGPYCPKKERIVFQESIFRCELLVSRRVDVYWGDVDGNLRLHNALALLQEDGWPHSWSGRLFSWGCVTGAGGPLKFWWCHKKVLFFLNGWRGLGW